MTAFLVGALLHHMGFCHTSREQGMGQGLGVGTPPLSSLGLLAPAHSSLSFFLPSFLGNE